MPIFPVFFIMLHSKFTSFQDFCLAQLYSFFFKLRRRHLFVKGNQLSMEPMVEALIKLLRRNVDLGAFSGPGQGFNQQILRYRAQAGSHFLCLGVDPPWLKS